MRYYLSLSMCPHDTRAITLDDDCGGGTLLTGHGCCGRWEAVRQFPMNARSLMAASEELFVAANNWSENDE